MATMDRNQAAIMNRNKWQSCEYADWMPKQGHSADLQAETAAHNILAFLEGRPGTREFRVELVCVVDSLDSGTLVYRTPTRNILLKSPLFHNAKSFFERRYLARYR